MQVGLEEKAPEPVKPPEEEQEGEKDIAFEAIE